MVLHIHGKGKKDRYVPLPELTLDLLREFWRTHRSPEWLFPAPTRHGLKHILHCRTPFFGGHVYTCAPCSRKVYAYHSCGCVPD